MSFDEAKLNGGSRNAVAGLCRLAACAATWALPPTRSEDAEEVAAELERSCELDRRRRSPAGLSRVTALVLGVGAGGTFLVMVGLARRVAGLCIRGIRQNEPRAEARSSLSVGMGGRVRTTFQATGLVHAAAHKGVLT